MPFDQDDDPREEPMNKRTKRRKRRRANAVVRDGKAAVRKHVKKTGRTGDIHTKRTPSSKRVIYKRTQPNPLGPIGHGLGVQQLR